MNMILLAFDFPSNNNHPSSYKKLSGHIIFDIKMDFMRKSRWFKDDDKLSEPTNSNFAGVVSTESVQIVFTYTALNNLDVCSGNIKLSYLQAPLSEKNCLHQ